MTDSEKPEDVTMQEWDAAKRFADAVNLHVDAMRAENRDRPGFVGVHLLDGRASDGVLYDTRRDLIRHHRNDMDVLPVKVGKHHMKPREALIVLKFQRQARRNGVIFAEEELITPNRLELLPGGLARLPFNEGMN